MITNFEEITKDLTSDEKKLLPWLIGGFKKITINNPLTAPQILGIINRKKGSYNIKKDLTEPRLRKLINFIRSFGIIPIIGTSKGYYVSYDIEELNKQIQSTDDRIRALQSQNSGMKKIRHEEIEKQNTKTSNQNRESLRMFE